MALFSLISGTYKNSFFSFFALFLSILYLTSLQTAKTTFIKCAALWLLNLKFKPNKYSSPQN